MFALKFRSKPLKDHNTGSPFINPLPIQTFPHFDLSYTTIVAMLSQTIGLSRITTLVLTNAMSQLCRSHNFDRWWIFKLFDMLIAKTANFKNQSETLLSLWFRKERERKGYLSHAKLKSPAINNSFNKNEWSHWLSPFKKQNQRTELRCKPNKLYDMRKSWPWWISHSYAK